MTHLLVQLQEGRFLLSQRIMFGTTMIILMVLCCCCLQLAEGFHQQQPTLSLFTRRVSISSWSSVIDPTTTSRPTFTTTSLYAKTNNKKKKKSGSGGGFGGGMGKTPAKQTSSTGIKTIGADKTSLEKQWDNFVAITDLEIRPKNEEENFEVVDVFVRSGGSSTATEGGGTTKWFRIGKVCAELGEKVTDDDEDNDGENIAEQDDNDTATSTSSSSSKMIEIALTLQKGLIFWTAVHMRRELVAAGGKSGAASLQLGYTVSSMNVGSEQDPPLDDEEAAEIQIAQKASGLKDMAVTANDFGFRPDWNPPGFTYKRREKDATKKKNKKKSTLGEIASI